MAAHGSTITCSGQTSVRPPHRVEHSFLTANTRSGWMQRTGVRSAAPGPGSRSGVPERREALREQGAATVTPRWLPVLVGLPGSPRRSTRTGPIDERAHDQMAACTTAPGIGVPGWPATSRVVPRGAIPRGPLGGSQVTTVPPYRRRRLAVCAAGAGRGGRGSTGGRRARGLPLAAPERRPASSSAGPTDRRRRARRHLWSIATRLAPGDDPRPLVDELTDARGSGPLQPGERIRVPG